MYQKVILLVCTALMLPFASQASENLSTREVNELKIELRALHEKRDSVLEDAVKNESDLDLLLRFADGEDLSVMLDKALPAAGSVAAGGALDLVAAKKLLPRYAPILEQLPKYLRMSAQRVPTIVGAVVAALVAYDAVSYNERVERLKKLSLQDGALVAEHDRLYNLRSVYSQMLKMLDERILALDVTLSPYTK